MYYARGIASHKELDRLKDEAPVATSKASFFLSVCECSGSGEKLRLRRSDGLISCYHGADVLPFRLSVGEIHTAPSKQLLILFSAMHSRS